MNQWVSNQTKRSFLQQFFKHFRFKLIEVKKLLEFIMAHDHLLEKLRFTDQCYRQGRTIIVSTVCVDQVPFQYVNKQNVTTRIEAVYEDLRANPFDSIYIMLNFRGKAVNYQYKQLLQPYLVERKEALRTKEQLSQEAERILNESMLLFHIDYLMKEIDKALDIGDQKRFIELSKQVNEYRAKLRT